MAEVEKTEELVEVPKVEEEELKRENFTYDKVLKKFVKGYPVLDDVKKRVTSFQIFRPR